MCVLLLLSADRAQSQGAASLSGLPLHHHFCHGSQHPPGGGLHQPPAHPEWLPAPPVSQREPHHQRPQTCLTGKYRLCFSREGFIPRWAYWEYWNTLRKLLDPFLNIFFFNILCLLSAVVISYNQNLFVLLVTAPQRQCSDFKERSCSCPVLWHLFDPAEFILLCKSVAYFSLSFFTAITSFFVIPIYGLNAEHRAFDNDVVVDRIL